MDLVFILTRFLAPAIASVSRYRRVGQCGQSGFGFAEEVRVVFAVALIVGLGAAVVAAMAAF
jgi:hypothetical protein